MVAQITYNDLIRELDNRFPQFRTYLGDTHKLIENNVSVYFTFFSIYLHEHWTNEPLQQQVAQLLHHMHQSGDEATRITLHDFLLDVCSSCREHNTDLHFLSMHLTPALQQQLNEINEQWLTAACALHRGCC